MSVSMPKTSRTEILFGGFLVVSPIEVSAYFLSSSLLLWFFPPFCPARLAHQGVASTANIFPEREEGAIRAPAAKVAKALRGTEKGGAPFCTALLFMSYGTRTSPRVPMAHGLPECAAFSPLKFAACP